MNNIVEERRRNFKNIRAQNQRAMNMSKSPLARSKSRASINERHKKQISQKEVNAAIFNENLVN